MDPQKNIFGQGIRIRKKESGRKPFGRGFYKLTLWK